ncbi:MAG: glycosyltransferase family 2 protein [Sulfuricaulis sp.]
MESRNTPRVSIGVPVYNGERYIAETLDSLVAQTYRDFEIIICDNASTDRTQDVCRSYVERDVRIRYVRNAENIGASRNYKLALDLSCGEYFRWANSDDLFAPEGLARCVDILDREPSVVLAYPKTKFIDERGNVISEYHDEMHMQSPMASERFAQVMTKLGYVNIIYGLMRATILRKTGLLRNFPGGDIPLVAELTLYGKFHEIPEFLFYRRLHSKASSSYKADVSLTQEFFDPKTKGRISFRQWQHLGAHVRSTLRAPLNFSEKMRLIIYILRMGVWKRRLLIRELTEAVRLTLRGLLTKAGDVK